MEVKKNVITSQFSVYMLNKVQKQSDVTYNEGLLLYHDWTSYTLTNSEQFVKDDTAPTA